MRTKWVGTITALSVRYVAMACKACSGSNRGRMTEGMPATSNRMPDSGPV